MCNVLIKAVRGSETKLLQFHPLKKSRHTVTNLFSCHSMLIMQFEICLPCYRDYTRNRHNKENVVSRWARIKQDAQGREPKHVPSRHKVVFLLTAGL